MYHLLGYTPHGKKAFEFSFRSLTCLQEKLTHNSCFYLLVSLDPLSFFSCIMFILNRSFMEYQFSLTFGIR